MRLFGFEITRPKPRTALHPDYKSLVQFAFEIDGVSYYEFKSEFDMHTRRFEKMQEFLREAEMRMTRAELVECLDTIDKATDQGKLTDVAKMTGAIRYRLNQFIEIDSFYRLFSCVFFTLDENLTDYDYDVNEIKIKAFKSSPLENFFFSQPVRKYLPQTDINEADLKAFLKESKVSGKYLKEVRSLISKESQLDG